jgi:hypothetical protein
VVHWVRIFKTKAFTRLVDKAGILDRALCGSILDAERRLIAADLGGGIIKQRIARGSREVGRFSDAYRLRGRHAGHLCSRIR